MNKHSCIKNIFKEKNFQFIWLAKLLEIAPFLIIKDVKKDTGSKGSWLLVLSVGKNTITFSVTDDPSDLDYEDWLGIYDCSIEELRDELQMDGTFYGRETNFSYREKGHIRQLASLLDKFRSEEND